MHPPREVWRLKVRVLRLWVVPSFDNHEVPNSMEMILLDDHCEKIKAIVKKQLLNSLTMRCALFGDYVNQVNHFLASGYVEQPIVVIQLAKVKFFRGQIGLQNVMYATQMLFNPDLSEVVEFRRSMIEQCVKDIQPLFIANEGKVVSLEDDFMRLTRRCTIEELQDNNEEGSFIIFGIIRGIVEDGSWWYSACVCGKGIYPQNGAYYCDFCVKHITNVTPRDTNIKKESSSTSIKSDNVAAKSSGILSKFLVLIDFLAEKQPDVFEGIEIAVLINDKNGKAEKTPKNDTLSDDFSYELDILLSSPVKETQEVFFQVLNVCSYYGEKVIHEDHVVTSKGKRNLNPQFDEAANDANGRGSKIAKVDGV
ncbi:uncharacterized protein DS421_14g453410 [Arachis hypogaea]|nr:uncharacterized protein DS421_14g453410 [Arachis hypogaea]